VTEAVTTVVRRRVKPDRRAEYDARLRRLQADAATAAPGYLGAEVHPPQPGAAVAEYTSVFRFASLAELEAFARSALRESFVADIDDLVEADAVWDRHTGLEFWFAPPPGTVVAQPVRWRMAVVVGSVVYLLVLVFGTLAGALLDGWPAPLRLAAVIVVEIALMTYVLLPWLTRRLARWIFPRQRAA
jgi:antibiotic biosynthesis monooxygenase (ABM) superfamily enzyme